MSKKVSVATVAKRMNRILATYREQNKPDETSPSKASASTSTSASSSSSSPSPSTFGQMTYSTERGLVLHKTILNFAAQNDSESESDTSDQSYALIESPQPAKSRRRQPNRAVKRPAMRMTDVVRTKRKPSSTVTSKSMTADRMTPTLEHTEIGVEVAKASRSFNENDNRQSTM